jgi:hypothetical protein
LVSCRFPLRVGGSILNANRPAVPLAPGTLFFQGFIYWTFTQDLNQTLIDAVYREESGETHP